MAVTVLLSSFFFSLINFTACVEPDPDLDLHSIGDKSIISVCHSSVIKSKYLRKMIDSILILLAK